MTTKVSAGLMMYRRKEGRLEVFLVHPGGPYFARKDDGCWSIPKGELEPAEDPLSTARREFEEETGLAPRGEFISLESVTQKGGKQVLAWAFEGDWEDGRSPASNTCEIEWPPRSGRMQRIPEIDRAEFFPADVARIKINSAQAELITRLETCLATKRPC
jgi:predicted NUDIX family NTP pyrophosphohydrolase